MRVVIFLAFAALTVFVPPLMKTTLKEYSITAAGVGGMVGTLLSLFYI